ncbi:MAG: RNA signal recognition particle 4.5S RNA [Hoeflea sp. BRH_c9]|nr:MAG: RNA signal recognition particle 4.5S RNA [Hoeflea sp. BRH_c9]
MAYVNGFLVAVPTAKKQDYLNVAKQAAEVFKDHGAIQVVEAWGDDVPDGKLTSMPMAVQLKEDETVVFSWITWPDKAAQTAGMENSMKDPRMDYAPENMPFDGKRMIWGGFEVIVEA